MKKREARNFYIYTAPWLIGFLVLTLYPILYSFYLMFTNMNLTGIGEFVGLDNWFRAALYLPFLLHCF